MKMNEWIEKNNLTLFPIHGFVRRQREFLRKSSLASRLTRGISWTIVGHLVSSASTIVASIIVARILGAAQFGSLGIIQSSLGTFMVLAGSSLGLTGTKHIAELKTSDPERAGRILSLTITIAAVLSGCMSLAIMIAAPVIATDVLIAPHLEPHLRVAAIMMFFSGIGGAQTGALAGFEAFKSIAIVNILRGAVALPVLWLGARYFGLMGVVIALGVIEGFVCSLCTWILRQKALQAKVKATRRGMWREVRLLHSFSLPAYMTAIVFFAAVWIGNLILVRQPNGYVEMGVFNAVSQWQFAILFFPTVMAQPFLSIMANLEGIGEMRQYRKVFILSVMVTTAAAVLPAAIISLFSGRIMIAYGSEFYNGKVLLILMAIAAAISAPVIAIRNALTSKGKMWDVFGLFMAWAVVFIVSFYLLKSGGSQGLGWAYVIAYFVYLAGALLLVKKVNMNVSSRENAPAG